MVVVATRDEPPLPFADEAFDLVTTRHPISVWWTEILRVLRPGAHPIAQHIGPATMSELAEYFIGPQQEKSAECDPDTISAQGQAGGLRMVDMRLERLRAEFFDIGAVIYFLRKVIWTVPDFSVQRYRDRLRELHERIEASRAVRRAPDTGPRRGAQTRLIYPSLRSMSSACCRSGGYGLTISIRRPSPGCANASDRACSHCRCSPSFFASFGSAP